MDKTKKLRDIIINKYGSIREFSKIANIPSTTLTSSLDRGIGGMAVDRVIKICEILNIDIKTFEPIEKEIKQTEDAVSIEERKLLKNFNKLNKTGKDEAIKRVEELTYINKYIDANETKVDENSSYLNPVAAHDDNLTIEEKNRMDEIILKKLKELGKL